MRDRHPNFTEHHAEKYAWSIIAAYGTNIVLTDAWVSYVCRRKVRPLRPGEVPLVIDALRRLTAA